MLHSCWGVELRSACARPVVSCGCASSACASWHTHDRASCCAVGFSCRPPDVLTVERVNSASLGDAWSILAREAGRDQAGLCLAVHLPPDPRPAVDLSLDARPVVAQLCQFQLRLVLAGGIRGSAKRLIAMQISGQAMVANSMQQPVVLGSIA